ncbi:MAG: protein kinase [Polyangiaceae bacterium]
MANLSESRVQCVGAEPRPGLVLGRYELLMPIAKGGMAQVWAARLRGTRGFRKIFAVKTIRADIESERLEEMLLEEATLAAQIHHPNVVTTVELGDEAGLLYLVMEWVDGESLSVVGKAAGDAGIPMPIAVNLVGQVCKGLNAAHELRDEAGNLLGVVHRDISPQNILVGYDGTAKLVDFGIAKATHRSSSLTMEGEIKGKFAYMAPEQVNQQGVDRRTDLFALGILLYTLTTGRHPFRGDTPAATIRNVLTRPVTPPGRIVEDYPVELEAIVMRALAREPNERFQTAHELLSALERAAPEWLEGSFEVSVAGYMRALLGDQAALRRAELKRAQADLDRELPEPTLSSSSGSYSSLRAITLDPVPGATAEPSDGESESGSLKSGGALLSAQALAPTKPSGRRGRAVFALLGTCVVVAALAWFWGRSASREDEPVSAAVVPPSTAPPVAPEPTPQPSIRVVAEPEPAPSTAPSTEGNDEKARPSLPRARWAAPARVAKPVTSAKTEAQVKGPSSEAPPTKGSANAWDPSTFGGRQ